MARYRKGVLSLSMIVLMLLSVQIPIKSNLPPEPESYSSSSGSICMNVVAYQDVWQYDVTVDIEFSNLTMYESYNYEIWFTRVDPNFSHHTIVGNFTAMSSGHNLSKMWSPGQDGPYTVHSNISKGGLILQYGNDTFGWGDVANHSGSAIAAISIDYTGDLGNDSGIGKVDDRYYLNISTNETLQSDLTINFDAMGTENGNNYTMDFSLFKISADGDMYVIGMGTHMLHASYTLSAMKPEDGWIEGQNYKFTLEVVPDDYVMLDNPFGVLNFTIGIPPIPIIAGCTDLNATNYDQNATDDDGSCVFSDDDGDGVFNHLEIDGCTDSNATNFEQNATEEDGSCVFKDTDGDLIPAHLEVEGCMDKDADNFNDLATEHRDGDCTYPEFLLRLNSDYTYGDAPLDVSFVAEITGGNAPYEILWNFGDGDTSTQNMVSHTFEEGVWSVVLQVTDDSNVMLQETIPIVASGDSGGTELTGYFSFLDQMENISIDMVATFQFDCVGYGGEGTYTYIWDFGDEKYDTGTSVLHEYERYGEYIVTCSIEDSAGSSLEIEKPITVIKPDDEEGGVSPTQEGLGEGGSNLDLYATSAGAVGLLLIFGLFGRKRRGGFLEAERLKASGEGSIWDD